MSPSGDRPWPARQEPSLLLAVVCSCCLHLMVIALPPQSKSATPPQVIEVRFKASQSDSAIREATNSSEEMDDLPSSTDPAPPPLPALPLANRYYLAAEVSEKAEPIEIPPLIYPEDAYLRRIEGIVILRVFINASGGIDSVDILSAQPPDVFERSALDAVLSTQFHPARLFGRPVNSQKTLEIRFDPFADH